MYLDWNEQTKTPELAEGWLDEWVYAVENRTEYLEKMDTKRFLDLQPQTNCEEIS